MGPRDLSHHSKLPMMLRLHGSITPKLVIPILLVSGWATAVTCISKLLYDRKLFLSSFDMFLPGLTLRSRDRSSFHYRAGLRCESSTQRPQFHLYGPILPRPTTLGTSSTRIAYTGAFGLDTRGRETWLRC